MNGVHDMGGMHGFGRVEIEKDEPVFHEEWEGRVMGMLRQVRQPSSRLKPWSIEGRRAGCDENCVEDIVFGAPQMHARIGPDLHRLQHEHLKTCFPQIPDDTALIAP